MTPTQPKLLVVGIDGTLPARRAARWAVEYAEAGDTVELFHAWKPSPSTSEVGMTHPHDERAAQRLIRREVAHLKALADRRGVAVVGIVAHGEARELLRHIGGDVVVVGSGGRGRVSRALTASVCSSLAQHSDTPVVIVPLMHAGRRWRER